jgi:hypothetical protein
MHPSCRFPFVWFLFGSLCVVSSAVTGKLMRRSHRLFATLVPSAWKHAPEGWVMFPSSSVDAGAELDVKKTLLFLKQNSQYNLLGQVMAFAGELNCIPKVEWFYAELTFTLPPTPAAEKLALFINDQERLRCGLRNQSKGTSVSGMLWSPELTARVQTISEEDFCWCLTEDRNRTQQFLQDTMLQWHNRADYLVARKSREKKEFRQDITLNQVIQEGQERKRRMQQRKMKEVEKTELTKEKKLSEWDNFVADVLPREVRESLDRESDGMEDVRFSRNGSTTAGYGRSMRTPGFSR